MNVFVSHSWKNKTAAQLIADTLKAFAQIWLDVRHLKPGDPIQSTIDAALAEMDVVLVLWSKQASRSRGVAAEIATAARLGKRIVPVLLDRTPLDRQASLKGLYGLNFDLTDPKAGLFRIQAGLARSMLANLDIESARALNDLTSFEGFYQYVEDYRNKGGIRGKDSLDWALKSMEQCNLSCRSLSDLRDRVGLTLEYIQGTLTRVQAAGDDADAIQAVLSDVLRHPNSQTNEFKTLIAFIEGKLASLPACAPRPLLRTQETPRILGVDLERLPALWAEKRSPTRNLRGDPDEAPSRTQGDPRLRQLENYVRAARSSLGQFTRLVRRGSLPALQGVAARLHQYLANPDDLIPDDQNGLLGFADDAWLIHNTLYRCAEAGLIDADALQVDWGAIQAADRVVVACLPADVRAALTQILFQFLRLLAAEAERYEPRFAPRPAARDYDPFMWTDEVAEAEPEPQSIDDLPILWSGGKATWIG